MMVEPAVEIAMGPDRMIVTIDGPAGTGKSTVGRELAARLGLALLDTGAMYRAAAAIVLDQGIDPADEERVVEAVAKEDLHFDFSKDPPSMLCSGTPVDDRIREQDVTRLVSRVSAIAALRTHMVRKQRIVAHQHPRLVAEGRDQGSVVFPDADVKFYLEATPGERARRRAEQMRCAGQDVDERALRVEIEQRDNYDSTRAVGPLRCPEGATRLDTSELSFDEVVDELERIVRQRIAEQTPTRGDGGSRPGRGAEGAAGAGEG